MQGIIRKREVLAHPLLTVKCFGWPLFLKALTADGEQTFLSLLTEEHMGKQRHCASLIDDCAELELRAQRIYLTLAGRFADHHEMHRFFHAVAAQEHSHFELLTVCRTLAELYGWNEQHLDSCRESITSVSRTLSELEDEALRTRTATSTLSLVLDLEATEINYNFAQAIQAVGSPFLRGMRVFHAATVRHVAYVCDGVATMAPKLAGVCERLKTDATQM